MGTRLVSASPSWSLWVETIRATDLRTLQRVPRSLTKRYVPVFTCLAVVKKYRSGWLHKHAESLHLQFLFLSRASQFLPAHFHDSPFSRCRQYPSESCAAASINTYAPSSTNRLALASAISLEPPLMTAIFPLMFSLLLLIRLLLSYLLKQNSPARDNAASIGSRQSLRRPQRQRVLKILLSHLQQRRHRVVTFQKGTLDW